MSITGATFKFDIALKPALSQDLSQFISDEVQNFDVDLPGPDVITRLCVNEDKIKQQIKDGVDSVVTSFNGQIRSTFVKILKSSLGNKGVNVDSLFDHLISTTFQRVSFPAVSQTTIGSFTIVRRQVTADPAFGFPRVLFA